MTKLVMLRISQKTSTLEAINNFYKSLEGEKIILKRIFDPRITFSGDDLIVEGDLTNLAKKLIHIPPNFLGVKFQVQELEKIKEKLVKMSTIHMTTEHITTFFGVTLVHYSSILQRLRLPEKNRLLPLLLRSQLGAYFITLMPVKVKGLVLVNSLENSVEFVLPTQRIETLKEWLNVLQTEKTVDFDVLVNIYQNFDPQMRKNMETTMQWIDLNLPELVARYAEIEEIDVYRVYKNALSLI